VNKTSKQAKRQYFQDMLIARNGSLRAATKKRKDEYGSSNHNQEENAHQSITVLSVIRPEQMARSDKLPNL